MRMNLTWVRFIWILGLLLTSMTWASSYNGEPDINIKNSGDIPNGGAYNFGDHNVGS